MFHSWKECSLLLVVFSGGCSESWRKGISERRRKLLEGENSKTQQSPVNILMILPDLKSAACCCPFFFRKYFNPQGYERYAPMVGP